MAMLCPQCNGTFDQQTQCPNCRVRLLYQAEVSGGTEDLPGQNGQWQHTPWGRILVGLLLAQGLYHGMRQLFSAGWFALQFENATEGWNSVTGLLLQQGIQTLSLLAGGILAGAGQRRGVFLGTVVGISNGALMMLIEQFSGTPLTARAGDGSSFSLTALTAYGEIILLTAYGAAGGLIGSLIWKPLPTIDAFQCSVKNKAPRYAKTRGPSLFSGPIAWTRVLVGIAICVCGASWAKAIFDFVIKASEDKLSIQSPLQLRLVTMEISALSILLGGGIAGATRTNGLKQGLCVGIGATVVMLGTHLAGPRISLDFMLYSSLSNLILALAGGWFGGQLFPPIYGRTRGKRKFGPAY